MSSDRRVIIFGADGLRPDLVDPALMPTYARLMTEGTVFSPFQAAYPPHTRVNMSTFTTGTRPGSHGVVANLMYVAGAGEEGWLNTSNEAQLRAFPAAVGQPLLLRPTLGDRLAADGRRLAVAGAGTTGASLLWNLNRPARIINAGSAYGDPDLTLLLEKLGPVPEEHDHTKYQRARWATTAATDVLLDDPDNQVIVLWLSEPDGSQHFHGLGSPQATEALRVVDACLSRLLRAIDERGLAADTDLLLLSDHGHSTVRAHRSLRDYLAVADEKLGLNGSFAAGGDYIYRLQPEADAEPLLRWLLEQPWTDVVFSSDPVSTTADGCLPIELALGPLRHDRAPLFAVSPRWHAERNEFGVPGAVQSLTSLSSLRSSHGAASPFDLTAFCTGYGPSFRQGHVTDVPCGTVDVAPTIAAILGLSEQGGFDGRVMREGLRAHAASDRPEVTVSGVPSGPQDQHATLRLAVVEGRSYMQGTEARA